MPKRSKGYSTTVIKRHGKWCARIRFNRADGTPREVVRQGINKTDAKAKANELIDEFITNRAADDAPYTFRELAERYIKAKCVPAVYAGERKMAGLKRPDTQAYQVRRLIEYFKDKPFEEVTYSDLEAFKFHLLTTPTKRNKPRSAYDVNHQMRALRTVFGFARRSRWIRVNPFEDGPPLVNAADEIPRDRPQGEGEFGRLLEQCAGRRAHLYLILLLHIDTALRPAEVLRLTPSDLLFDDRLIVGRATSTKLNKQRLVPMTERLSVALQEWLSTGLREWLSTMSSHHDVDLDTLLASPTTTIFGNVREVKTAWRSMLKAANIEGVQRRDMRHWATTEMVDALAAANISHRHGMVVTGHSSEQTFRRYTSTDRAKVQDVRDALESFRKKKEAA